MESPPLTPELIHYAYCQGVFPMADELGEISWYEPRQRCLFPIGGIHVSHSLGKVLRRREFEITFDTCFERVIRGCLRPSENWINEDIIRVYTEIHYEGWGHSCEVWKDGELVGGTYGLAIGSCFCAESMFHRVTNASKVALHSMIDKCRELGFTMFDAQIQNPHLASLGAYQISLGQYRSLLNAAMSESNSWSGLGR